MGTRRVRHTPRAHYRDTGEAIGARPDHSTLLSQGLRRRAAPGPLPQRGPFSGRQRQVRARAAGSSHRRILVVVPVRPNLRSWFTVCDSTHQMETPSRPFGQPGVSWSRSGRSAATCAFGGVPHWRDPPTPFRAAASRRAQAPARCGYTRACPVPEGLTAGTSPQLLQLGNHKPTPTHAEGANPVPSGHPRAGRSKR